MRVITFLLVLLASTSPCNADDWRSAQPFERRSPNGLYSIRVNLGSGDAFDHKSVGQREKNATATWSSPEGERRTFLLLNPRSPVDGVLLDDGTFLAFDNWAGMGLGAVLACYSPEGTVKWSHELEGLLSKEAIRRVPWSMSSRWWRKDPLEWETEGDEAGPIHGFVTLWNEDKLRVRLADGVIEYVEVQELGNDAQRLLSRGEDLLKREELSAASEVLNRAIALKPDLFTAYRVLSEVHVRQEDHEAAVKVLVQGIQGNPAIDVVPSKGSDQGDRRLWLLIHLARVYEKAGRFQDAQATYRECLRLDPEFWIAGQELSRILLKNAQHEEADHLLAGFFVILRGDAKGSMAGLNLDRAALEVGRVYQERALHAKAKRYYLLAYGQAEPSASLSLALAEVLEALGEYKEAAAVLQKVRIWLTGRKYEEFSLKRAEKDLARVLEKLRVQEKPQVKAVSTLQEPVKPPPVH